MKTPREILLEAHHAARLRIGQARENVLTQKFGPSVSVVRKFRRTSIWQKLWLELIWPSRHTWATLAAIWVVMALAHFADPHTRHKSSSPAGRQFFAAWQQKQRLLSQALANAEAGQETIPAPATSAAPPHKSAQWQPDEKNARV